MFFGRNCHARQAILLVPLNVISSFEGFYQRRLTLWRYFDNIGNMENKDAVRALSALAQESRLEVFRLLVRTGPSGLAAGELSERLGLPPATMSFHLKELTNAGLIRSRRESRSIIYSADFEQMQSLLGFLLENCCADNGGKC